MKYYKLIKNPEQYPSYILNKIYPENYSAAGKACTVLDYYNSFLNRKNWIKVSAGDYYVQEGIMPEYFAIERVESNPLWEKYIDWLNNTYLNNLMGYIDEHYGFDNGVSMHAKLKYFKNNPVELTLEQWDKIINKKEETMNKEIIGWKLKEDCNQYEQAALNIVNQSKFYNFAEGYNFSTNSENEITFKKAGVLELWFTPVYKEKTLRFGGYDVTFEKVTSGVRITCNGETGTFSQIQAIYNFFKGSSASFKFGSQEVKGVKYPSASWKSDFDPEPPTSIKIGCTTGTWKEFVAIYEKAKSML